jgi:hypothetical protein
LTCPYGRLFHILSWTFPGLGPGHAFFKENDPIYIFGDNPERKNELQLCQTPILHATGGADSFFHLLDERFRAAAVAVFLDKLRLGLLFPPDVKDNILFGLVQNRGVFQDFGRTIPLFRAVRTGVALELGPKLPSVFTILDRGFRFPAPGAGMDR